MRCHLRRSRRRRWHWLDCVCCWMSSISSALTWASLVFLLWTCWIWLENLMEQRWFCCCFCYDLWEREGVFGLLVLKGRGKGEMVKTHAIKNWESGQHESWVFWRLDFGLWLVWIMNRCLAQVFPLLIYSFSLFRCL